MLRPYTFLEEWYHDNASLWDQMDFSMWTAVFGEQDSNFVCNYPMSGSMFGRKDGTSTVDLKLDAKNAGVRNKILNPALRNCSATRTVETCFTYSTPL